MNYFTTEYRQVYRSAQTTCLRDSRWNSDRLHSVPRSPAVVYTPAQIFMHVCVRRRRRRPRENEGSEPVASVEAHAGLADARVIAENMDAALVLPK